MIEIPIGDSIKVGSYTYELRCGDNIVEELECKGLWGSTWAKVKRVDLNTRSSPEQFSNTVVHELLHCVDKEYLADKLEEDTITLLTNGIHQVLEQLGVRFVPSSRTANVSGWELAPDGVWDGVDIKE